MKAQAVEDYKGALTEQVWTALTTRAEQNLQV